MHLGGGGGLERGILLSLFVSWSSSHVVLLFVLVPSWSTVGKATDPINPCKSVGHDLCACVQRNWLRRNLFVGLTELPAIRAAFPPTCKSDPNKMPVKWYVMYPISLSVSPSHKLSCSFCWQNPKPWILTCCFYHKLHSLPCSVKRGVEKDWFLHSVLVSECHCVCKTSVNSLPHWWCLVVV